MNQPPSPTAQEGCATNTDGTLQDMSQITCFNNAEDKVNLNPLPVQVDTGNPSNEEIYLPVNKYGSDPSTCEDSGEEYKEEHSKKHQEGDPNKESTVGGGNERQNHGQSGRGLYHYHKKCIPPQEGDWELWDVPVPVGEEYAVVYQLLECTNEGMQTIWYQALHSVFAAYGVLGHVFVEAWEWVDVAAICKGMAGVRWWETQAVSFFDEMQLLKRGLPMFTP
ncbi:hypothetical protein D9756_010488 [Leucocoprinus leucothites]|uniref:NGN domain-containing protein n=1 Tax=Leucocoprinus leucothites TaxID=201217 RepID=A0A8H5CVT6_9AGAR|nr:hypothetical protein D9756_010488 [Leucoagaricus leucothites]